MNRGGFSWQRFLGISAFKSKISRYIGIPLTKSGRQRKIGALMEQFISSLFSSKSKLKNKPKKNQNY